MHDERPTHLDLFSGIGGFALAAKWAGFRTIGFCECDKYCQKVLAKNFLADAGLRLESQPSDAVEMPAERNGAVGPANPLGRSGGNGRPWIVGDIRSLDGTQFRRNGSSVTLVTGGFPCQPFSCAGKRRGKADDRHLWPEMLRVINEARPAWVLGENVAGIIGMELDAVLSDLEAIGYTTRPFVIPACGVDARHRRNRVWIVGARRTAGKGNDVADRNRSGRTAGNGNVSAAAYGHSITASSGDVADAGRNGGRENIERRETEERTALGRCCEDVANGNESGLQRQDRNGATAAERKSAGYFSECCEWQPEPDVGRVAHGIPARVDRLRGLGNAVVPQVAFQILKAIRAQIENAPRTFY